MKAKRMKAFQGRMVERKAKALKELEAEQATELKELLKGLG